MVDDSILILKLGNSMYRLFGTPPQAHIRPVLAANKTFSAKRTHRSVLLKRELWSLQAYSLEVSTKPRNRTAFYISFSDTYKSKKNQALNVVVYKIYYVYHVDQSSRLSLVTSFVEQILPP
jgi:hypothetical protein